MQERVLGLISAFINAIVDIGVTLWKFISGINSCEKSVRQEDLRVAVDKNDLLIQYCKENNIEYPEPPTDLEGGSNSTEKVKQIPISES